VLTPFFFSILQPVIDLLVKGGENEGNLKANSDGADGRVLASVTSQKDVMDILSVAQMHRHMGATTDFSPSLIEILFVLFSFILLFRLNCEA
jgi:hypothetical protein